MAKIPQLDQRNRYILEDVTTELYIENSRVLSREQVRSTCAKVDIEVDRIFNPSKYKDTPTQTLPAGWSDYQHTVIDNGGRILCPPVAFYTAFSLCRMLRKAYPRRSFGTTGV